MSDSTATAATPFIYPPLPAGFTRGSGHDAGTFYYQGQRIEGYAGEDLILEQPEIGSDAQKGSVVGVTPITNISGEPLIEWLQQPGVQAAIEAELEAAPATPAPATSAPATIGQAQEQPPKNTPAPVQPHSNGASEPGFVPAPPHVDTRTEAARAQAHVSRLHTLLNSMEHELHSGATWMAKEARAILVALHLEKP